MLGTKNKSMSGEISITTNRFSLWVAAFLAAWAIVTYVPIALNTRFMELLVREDGVYESLTALYFLFASVVFLMAWHYGRRLQSRTRYYYLALAAVFFVGCMEEISWGQRILNIGTPDTIAQINAQREINIHNLKWFHGKDEEGQRKDFWSLLLNIDRLFTLFWLMFCVVVPVLEALSRKIRRLIQLVSLPVIPIWMSAYFLANYGVSKLLESTNPSLVHAAVETKEQYIALLFLTVAILELRKIKYSPIRA